MKILLTGANGYIGRNLLPALIRQGHSVVCCVRSKDKFLVSDELAPKTEVIELDLLEQKSLLAIPHDIDAAYYLVHSMASSTRDFSKLEALSALNFRNAMEATRVRQVIYLSGIINEEKLSEHLSSRKKVEEILSSGRFNLTTLRAGIIVGKGSASFEIIRDLVTKLPLMVAPKWLHTRTQPISLSDTIQFLVKILLFEKSYNHSYDIVGPDILSYKEMLMQYAEVLKLKRKIIIIPVMTPRLSSYWLYFVTSTTYKLAVNLVDSMKVEVIGEPNELAKWLKISPMSYREAVIESL